MTGVITAFAIAFMVSVIALLRDISLRNKIKKLENEKADKDDLINQVNYTNRKLQEKLDYLKESLKAVDSDMRTLRDEALERRKTLESLLNMLDNGHIKNNSKVPPINPP